MPSTASIWTDIDLDAEARRVIAAAGHHLVAPPHSDDRGIEGADGAIVGSLLTGDMALFARAGRLRVIARSGIGYDRIDLAAATAAGVCVVNTPEAPTESTAEFAITLMLAVARRLPAGATPLSTGRWTQGAAIIGTDLAGKTLGVVGCGRIGRRVAEIARALGMDVQGFDPFLTVLPPGIRRAPDLATLLASSHVISLHVPASPANRHLIDRAALARLPAGAIVINTARGPLVDEAALLAELESGRLGGAGLDVWDPEPPRYDHPLLRHPLVIATPHMAAATHEGRRRSHVRAAEQVVQVLRDESPAHLLNPDVWPRRRRGA